MNRRGIGAVAVTAVVVMLSAGCGGGSGGGSGSGNGPLAPRTHADPAKAMNGKWATDCAALAPGSSRQTQYEFKGDTVEIRNTTFVGDGCKGTAAVVYRAVGKYRFPSPFEATKPNRPLEGEITEAYLTVQPDLYIREANRTPPLYGFTGWRSGNETSLKEKLTPEQFTAFTKDIFPKELVAAVENDKLLIGKPDTLKEQPLTKVSR